MAIKVHRSSSRLIAKIGEASFKLAPLSQENKVALMSYVSMDGGTRVENLAKMAFMSVKYCLKDVSGLEFEDGSEYKLEFDNDGLVSDKSISELMNTEISQELLSTCQAFMQGIPKEIINPNTKTKFDNIEILQDESSSKKN
jgi:hypothetical protein